MDIPQISIIMPVYNAEKNVSYMIDCILAQTFTNWELLCINDGSKDNSSTILDNYASKDTRIHVKHKKNAGVSAARQIGLEMSRGKYIIHADSDDWMDNTMLEELYNTATKNNADVVICDFYSNTDKKETYIQQKPSALNAQTILRDLFQQLHGSCWNKLISRACYSKLNARFFPGINYCEDLLFWVQIYTHSNVKTAYLNRAFYHYYVAPSHQSIMSSYSRNFFEMSCKMIAKIEEIIPDTIPFKQEIIECQKMSVKNGAFEHPIFTSKEYYAIYPEVNNKIMKRKTSIINRILLYLSYHGFYRSATWIYKLKNKLSGHYVR